MVTYIFILCEIFLFDALNSLRDTCVELISIKSATRSLVIPATRFYVHEPDGSWGAQIKASMNVKGGDVERATTWDYILHFFTLGWKVYIYI